MANASLTSTSSNVCFDLPPHDKGLKVKPKAWESKHHLLEKIILLLLNRSWILKGVYPRGKQVHTWTHTYGIKSGEKSKKRGRHGHGSERKQERESRRKTKRKQEENLNSCVWRQEEISLTQSLASPEVLTLELKVLSSWASSEFFFF